jgi:hypothetical protein
MRLCLVKPQCNTISKAFNKISSYATLYKAQVYVIFDQVGYVTLYIGGYITQLSHVYEPFIEHDIRL